MRNRPAAIPNLPPCCGELATIPTAHLCSAWLQPVDEIAQGAAWRVMDRSEASHGGLPKDLSGFTTGRIHLIVRHGRPRLADRRPIHFAPMFAFFSEDKFAAAGPAATAVLRHRATDLEIKDGAWSFDRGTASRDGRSSGPAPGANSHMSAKRGGTATCSR